MTPSPVSFEFPLFALGFGPNDRVHWATRARRTKDVRTVAYLAGSLHRKAKECGWPATLRYTVIWPKGKRRLNDGDNLLNQLKPCTDGMKDARLIHDDSPDWLTLLPVEQRKGTATELRVKVDIDWSGPPRPQERRGD
jgi:hypothetical protein